MMRDFIMSIGDEWLFLALWAGVALAGGMAYSTWFWAKAHTDEEVLTSVAIIVLWPVALSLGLALVVSAAPVALVGKGLVALPGLVERSRERQLERRVAKKLAKAKVVNSSGG